MLETDRDAVRERAYFIWLHEGCPEGRAQDHWRSATLEEFSRKSDQDAEFIDEEKVLAGLTDANIPAMLTKDVRGG